MESLTYLHYFHDLPPNDKDMGYVHGTAEVSGPRVEDIRLLKVGDYKYAGGDIMHTLSEEQLQAVRRIVRKDIDNPGLYDNDEDRCFYGC